MSAIAGLIHLDDAPVDREVVARMAGLLAACGPDAQRHAIVGRAGLVHTLLRSTPEDYLDRQPLADAHSGTHLVFDGRLDNREELGGALGIAAAELAQLADSALALRACLRWDVDAVERLLGDFALACWQPARRRLWLARDPLGHRPLYWTRRPGLFAFATQPKALFAIPGVPRALDEEFLAAQLALLPVRGPQSQFRDVFRVEPAHVLVLDDDRQQVRRYHRFDPQARLELRRDADYVEALREQLDRAVGCRLRSIGPVATHLSSGFDSSTITAVAARLLGARNQGLVAYTSVPRPGFDGRAPRGQHVDEGPGARALAARFPNIEHVLVPTQERSTLDGILASTEELDNHRPNPCNQGWTDAIQRDVRRRGGRALLSGQMGNMSISYHGDPWLGELLRGGHFLSWARELRAVHRVQRRRWRELLALSFGPFVPASAWAIAQRLRGRGRKLTDYTAISPAFLARMRTDEVARERGWDTTYRPWANGRAMRVAVLERKDSGVAFVNADVAGGVQIRAPLADVRLVEFCLSVPERQFLHEGRDRWLLRRLMGDVLPPEILESRTKGLQAADWYEGMGRDLPRLREEIARLAEHGGVGDYLDLPAMSAALDAWPQAGWHTPAVVQTYRLKVLRGIAAGAFIRHVEDNNR